MKNYLKILFCGIFMFTLHVAVFAQTDKLKQAADLYASQSYIEAVDIYHDLIKSGYVAPELYFNYANACYKSGQLGMAILNYERALVLCPSYEDAKVNLAFVNAQITDKIEPLQEFFVRQWIEDLGVLLTSNQWAYTSIIAFTVCLLLILLYVFSARRWMRKFGFFGSLVCLLITISALSYSFSAKNKSINHPDAIVMVGSMSVKSAPDESGTELFVLHEGTKVTVKSELSNWVEVRIADGHVGWVKRSQIEQI